MNIRKMKYLIILLSILIIITMTILIVLMTRDVQKDSNGDLLDDGSANLEKEENVYLVNNENLYFSIKNNIMQKYVKYVEAKDAQVVYNILSSNYKQENNVTIENVIDKLPSYTIPKFISQHMYMKEGNIVDNIYIEAIVQNNKITTNNKLIVTQNKEYYRIILDKENSTFAIEPIDVSLYEKLIKNKEQEEKNVEINENNQITYSNITEFNIVSEYLNNYVNLLKNDIEQAYELLNKDYKEAKYKDYSEFKKYIEDANATEGMILKTYTKKYNEDNSIQYICKDEYNRTYIFEPTAVMEYTVQLDDYTLENETFNKKYNKANNKDKGILNVDKFFKMINMQDYTSAYAVLDDNFKQNYFKTQTDFENYMKNKVLRYNKVNYKEYSNKITDIYTYKVVLTDMKEENQNQVEFNIVMKLLEGIDFVMSFEVN